MEGVFCKKSGKWGGVFFFVKKWTFSQHRVHYVQYRYFLFYILLIWGCVRTQRTPPCLRACLYGTEIKNRRRISATDLFHVVGERRTTLASPNQAYPAAVTTSSPFPRQDSGLKLTHQGQHRAVGEVCRLRSRWCRW